MVIQHPSSTNNYKINPHSSNPPMKTHLGILLFLMYAASQSASTEYSTLIMSKFMVNQPKLFVVCYQDL